MGIVRNRECCYWKKPECTWEHCAEITGNAIADAKNIPDQHCGNMAFEEIFLSGKIRGATSVGEALLNFIEDGSKAINEYCKQ